MKIFYRYLSLFGIFCCICFYSSQISAVESVSIEKNQKIEVQLLNLITKYNIPGAVLTYGFQGEPLQTVSVGISDIANSVPMTNDKQFIAGSITKSFIAVAILDLSEKHKINIDNNLMEIAQQYGGELLVVVTKYPALAQVTVRDLLVHTSGVPEDINTQAFTDAFLNNPKKKWSEQQLLIIAMQHPLYFSPGATGHWSYTNTDYLLLNIVLKSVSKKNVSQIFSDIWQRAELYNIYYPSTGVIPDYIFKKMSVGYLNVNDANKGLALAFKNLPIVLIPGVNKNIKAYELANAYTIADPSAGGIITNTQVLAKWYRALFEESMLSTNSVKMMLNGVNYAMANSATYGFGVTTHEMPSFGYVVSHDGLSPGYSVIVMYFFKYHLVMALATNSSNPYVSTFSVNSGKVIPGIVSDMLPLLVEKNA